MRGQDQSSSSPFGYLDLGSRVPARNPPIREMLGFASHLAKKNDHTGRTRPKSAFNGGTTRHPGCAFGRGQGAPL